MTPPTLFVCGFFEDAVRCRIYPGPFSTHLFFPKNMHLRSAAALPRFVFFRLRTPQTSNPKPEALNLKSQTSNPKAEALNLKSFSPNPKPEAFNLKS